MNKNNDCKPIKNNSAAAGLRKLLLGAALLSGVSACSSLSMPGMPQTVAARSAGFTYVPIDPLTVIRDNREQVEACQNLGGELNFLHDNSVRIAVSNISAKASIGGATGSVGVAGNSYRVVIDYIMADTANQSMVISKFVEHGQRDRTDTEWIPLRWDDPHGPKKAKRAKGEDVIRERVGYRVRKGDLRGDYLQELFQELGTMCDEELTDDVDVSAAEAQMCNDALRLSDKSPFAEQVNIPVYIGVGIRITSNLSVNRGKVSLSGLGALGVAADAEKVSGDLVIQTLGISGSKVANTLPLPSELNSTTIQNAITAMATLKAALYTSGEDLVVVPRVVGFYNPLEISDPSYISAVVTALSEKKGVLGEDEFGFGEASYGGWKPTCASPMPKRTEPSNETFADVEQRIEQRVQREVQLAMQAAEAERNALDRQMEEVMNGGVP